MPAEPSETSHDWGEIDARRTTLHGIPHLERVAARILLLDPNDRVLLLYYPVMLEAGRSMERWLLPGGGLDPGESFEDGARRELAEETGLAVEHFEGEIFRRDFTIRWGEGTLHQHERIFVARIDHLEPTIHAEERTPQWWTASDMISSGISTRPFELGTLVTRLLTDGLPPQPWILDPLIAPPVRELWQQLGVPEDQFEDGPPRHPLDRVEPA